MRALIALSLLAFFSILSTLIPATNAGKCCYADYTNKCADKAAGTPCCGYKKCDGLCCKCPGVQVIREEIQTVYHGTHYFWTSVITAPWSPENGWTTWYCRESHVTSWDLPPKHTGVKRFLPFAAQPIIPAPATIGTHNRTHMVVDLSTLSTARPTTTGWAPGFGTGIPTNDAPSETYLIDHTQSSHTGVHGPDHRTSGTSVAHSHDSSSATHRLPTVTHAEPSTLTTVPAFLNHAERAAELAELAAAAAAFKDASDSVTEHGVDVITLDGYLAYFNVDALNLETAYGRSVVEKFHLHDTDGDGVLTFEETQLLCDTDGCVAA